MYNARGFTLVELLVVIAIIGILSVLVVTKVNQSQDKARNSSAQTGVLQMGKAIDVFRNDVNNLTNTVINAYSASTVAAPTNVSITLVGTTDCTNTTPVFNGTTGICAMFTGVLSPSSSFTYGTDINKTPGAAYTYTYTTEGGSASKVLSANSNYLIGSNLVNGSSALFWITNGVQASGAAYPTI